MYSYDERMRAVQLYLKHNMSIAAVIREFGYPSRQMLYHWYSEYKKNSSLHSDCESSHSKYSNQQRRQAVGYYLEHNKNISETIRMLGFPKRTTLRDWINADCPKDEKHCVTGKILIKCTHEQKEQAVIRLCAGEGVAKEIAADFGVAESSLRRWKKELIRKECDQTMPKNTSISSQSQLDLATEKGVLEQQLEQLQREVYRLRLEHEVLKKADEILKKDQGINLNILTNREKAVLIDALRDRYRLKELLAVMSMAKSSYCYQQQALSRPDKYADLCTEVKAIFTEARGCYGYRRIHAIARKAGTRASEKVIRRIMRENQLLVYRPKKRKYSSYMGEICPEIENVINRDFNADKPNVKWLTDITEFSISAGKIYLSPIIDCFDGMAVSWTIGTSPDAELVNSMLDAAVSLLDKNDCPTIHSDRGGHYRWPGWIERMQEAGLTRSMSRKGCSPDNAACEGFFGCLKNEMFYGRSWVGISLSEFIHTLDAHLRWYNEKRIKMSLGAMSPLEYRHNLGF